MTTAQLRRLVNNAEPLWLIYHPDDPESSSGHIAGSLATNDEDLLAALAGATPMVFYGEHNHALRARTLATRFASEGLGCPVVHRRPASLDRRRPSD